ncbi:MAG: 30S ribosomal protein S13, small subunit ribosomal protein S13 [candidate division NC10 bacterium CSP1-5]|nr:MAG: 30S ribosomal protein S13, small subunit ribosomal protein S13 [candidate division NC10 bacterium CSP1-5]
MARIAGVDLPREKRLEVALTYIYGVGRSASRRILSEANVSPDIRVKNLTEDEVNRLRRVIEGQFRVEGDLRRDGSINVKRLIDIGCYRGMRHRRGLPVRGQRTHTNARTRKGPRRRTVGARRKT